MTTTNSTTSTRTGKGKRGRRARLSEVQREAADAVRAAKIAALHEQIGEQVKALTADPQWRAMLDAAAKFHTYSLGNQLLIELQAPAQRLGLGPCRSWPPSCCTTRGRRSRPRIGGIRRC